MGSEKDTISDFITSLSWRSSNLHNLSPFTLLNKLLTFHDVIDKFFDTLIHMILNFIYENTLCTRMNKVKPYY